MLNSKQRTILKAKASVLDPVFQIGKNGITDTVLEEIDNALRARELIKVKLLKNCDYTARDIIGAVAEEVGAEPVQAIGNMIVLYRVSDKAGIKHVL